MLHLPHLVLSLYHLQYPNRNGDKRGYIPLLSTPHRALRFWIPQYSRGKVSTQFMVIDQS